MQFSWSSSGGVSSEVSITSHVLLVSVLLFKLKQKRKYPDDDKQNLEPLSPDGVFFFFF